MNLEQSTNTCSFNTAALGGSRLLAETAAVVAATRCLAETELDWLSWVEFAEFLLHDMGDISEALHCAETAYRLHPEHPRVRAILSQCDQATLVPLERPTRRRPAVESQYSIV